MHGPETASIDTFAVNTRSICGLDCARLTARAKLERDPAKRRDLVLRAVPAFAARPRMLEAFVAQPLEGHLWHADHVVPVARGGGQCGLENVRTLCVLCHCHVTAQQCSARARERRLRGDDG